MRFRRRDSQRGTRALYGCGIQLGSRCCSHEPRAGEERGVELEVLAEDAVDFVRSGGRFARIVRAFAIGGVAGRWVGLVPAVFVVFVVPEETA